MKNFLSVSCLFIVLLSYTVLTTYSSVHLPIIGFILFLPFFIFLADPVIFLERHNWQFIAIIFILISIVLFGNFFQSGPPSIYWFFLPVFTMFLASYSLVRWLNVLKDKNLNSPLSMLLATTGMLSNTIKLYDNLYNFKMKYGDVFLLRKFSSLSEAERIKNLLNSNGIETIINKNLSSELADNHYDNVNLELWIQRSKVDYASKIIDQIK